MMRRIVTILLLALLALVASQLKDFSRPVVAKQPAVDDTPNQYSGSSPCRQCHESFYQLWASSHHGLAMQPYTPQYAKKNLQPQKEPVKIGKLNFKAEIGPKQGWVSQSGENGQKKYPIEHVLGGKNVYYFLTSLDRGRLQTLPIAYDVNKNHWFDTAASGVRHFPGPEEDNPVHWTDPLYTFNTSCYNCHVSQLNTNYDLKSDTYDTKWSEPGINCETCHGPCQEHVEVCQQAQDQQAPPPKDLKIIVTDHFTPEQMNSMCNSCHAKMSPISSTFIPGDRFYDHFALSALEHPDYYPDGRDLGENYTMTSWEMSECVKEGILDCIHCHTSSGRYRHKDDPDKSCLPCHDKRVNNSEKHTRHPKGAKGSKCIDCHMPMTQFAHMNRTDHSMRPPTPAATIAFKSPNACNMCHDDKDAAWADKIVRKWHGDYQQPTLDTAALVVAARQEDWKRLDDILKYIQNDSRDEVTSASLIRLLRSCNSEKKWPVIIKALQSDPSPLVRASAAEGLDGYITSDSIVALLNAAKDDYRLVRVRAASSLAEIDPDRLKDKAQGTALKKATAELINGMTARSDDYTSHFNLGNFYMEKQELQKAVDSYEASTKLRPDFIPSYVNVAFAHNAMGKNDKADQSFKKALKLNPRDYVSQLNHAMLLGEMGRIDDSEKAFRAALVIDPNSATASYNLGVLLAKKDPTESIDWCQKAYTLQPDHPDYGYTLAYFYYDSGNLSKAIEVLQQLVNNKIANPSVYALLGDIYIKAAQPEKAAQVYTDAIDNKNLSDRQRNDFVKMLQQFK